jgi:hypothetical protein
MLQPENWRYWVIAIEGHYNQIEPLKRATSLLKNDLELGITFFRDFLPTSSTGGFAYGFDWSSLVSYYLQNAPGPQPVVTLSRAELDEIQRNHALITSALPQYEHIEKSFERFRVLKSLPRESELTVIGLFSIIESLISHAPDPKDPNDSLTRQIREKMKLVSKRFDRSLDYGAYFDPSAKDETIWTKLYTYRSRIVHGSHTEFNGDLHVLRNKESTLAFLKETVKLLLLLSLKEPVLLTDLKAC